MDQFLERHNLPKLKQEKIDKMNRSVSIREIESILRNVPKQKAPDPDGFTHEFYQTSKEEIIPSIYNLFQR